MDTIFVICLLAVFAVGTDEEINCSEDRPKNIDMSPFIKSKTCKKIAQKKIVGGEEAVPHSFPYQAGLMYKVSDGKTRFCGGSLIGTEYILTAAHCLHITVEAVVYLGSHNLSEQTDGELRIKVSKSNFIIHEEWSNSDLSNDIALIKLPNPVQLTQNIQLVQLPPRSLPDLTGKLVTVTGWGSTRENPPEVSLVLRYVEIQVISNVECKAYASESGVWSPDCIRDTNLCTSGKDGKSTCFGDSGGPIVMKNSDKSITIVGLVSFGIFWCERGFPVANTRISSYLDWISSHTGLTIKD